jgi:cytochrome subunit of sulfide dehydrogenase
MKIWMPVFVLAVLIALSAAASRNAFSQQYDARRLAATCAGCHGTDGRMQGKAIPAIGGRTKEELLAQMQAFQSGARPASVMQQIAKGYTPAQLEAIAGYFAAQGK